MAHSELCYLPPGPACQVQGQAVSHLAHISPVTGGWIDKTVQVVKSVLLCTEVFSARPGTSRAGFFTEIYETLEKFAEAFFFLKLYNSINYD